VVHILKSHMKELLFTIEEFTNLSSRAIQYIAWSPKELLELIERRVGYSKLKWNDVFRCSKEEFLEFMQFKLRNGPRDLLRFIDIVFDSVGNGKAMAIVDFRGKEEDYRLYAFQQMQVVYGDVFKNIGDFVVREERGFRPI